MRSIFLAWCVGLVLAAGFVGVSVQAGDEPSAVEHAKPLPRTPGMLGTKAYSPIDREKAHFEQLPAEEKSPGALGNDDYSITGRVGKYVGWFGIVREITEEPEANRTQLLVEMKYFDGLTDLHIQVVSFTGGGDFRAVVPGTGLGIKHLSLVRVYGTVSKEEESLPHVVADFVVHWDWGLFTFMNYGTPRGNQSWRKLCKVEMNGIYKPYPKDSYYQARLGERHAGPATDEDGATPGKGLAEAEVAAKWAFRALKAGCIETYKILLPTVEDLEWLMSRLSESMTEEERDKMREQLEKDGGAKGFVEEAREKAVDMLQRVGEAAAEELDWTEAEFGGVIEEKLKFKEMKGIKAGDIWFTVVSGKETFVFQLKDCVLADRGWITPDGIRFRGKK